MTDLSQEAEKIYRDYREKKIINSPYQDAVVAFLSLIARILLERGEKPAKDSKRK